jgi:alkanesulfonate monooxygenase SsuD/methylene tetrahydromethanopterin reductase-like flavin-dependent oxidoreductase (luciferase family)
LSALSFGVFDHVDRNDLPLPEYYEARLQIVEAYERAGFYSYHVAEHHGTPLGMAPSPSVYLAAVAQRTKRLRFGPMVYALPLYHPFRLAEEICMLDQMSGGRLEIGFGRGASPIEMTFFGQSPPEAQATYLEGLQVIKLALTQKSVSFAGKYYQFDNVPMEFPPAQRPHPPIWYGAHAPETGEWAARQRFPIISLDPSALAGSIIERYRTTWRAENGDTPILKMGIGRFIVVAPTDDEALQLARKAYLRWHASFNHLFVARGVAVPRHARPATFDELHERGQGVAGSPATVRAWLTREIRTSGTNYLVGQFAFGDLTTAQTLASIDLFTRDVMPALREVS